MKKITLSTLLVAGIFVSCHKEDPAELPQNGVIASLNTCGNGIMDGQEEGIDCGGFACEPCEWSTGTCTLGFDDNYIYGYIPNASLDREFSKTVKYISNDRLVIMGTNSYQDTIRFFFSTPNPEYFSSYAVTSLDSLSEGKVYVEGKFKVSINFNTYTHTIRSMYASESQNANKRVHLNKWAGKPHLSFCAIDLRNYTVSQNFELEGKLYETE